MKDEANNFPYYADFLLRVINWIFPPLTKKGVEFYKWYFATYEPHVALYASSDLREMADSLDALRKDNNIDQLAEWLQHRTISNAAGVMDAIQRRVEQAEQKPHQLPGHPDGCVEAARFALLELASRIEKQS